MPTIPARTGLGASGIHRALQVFTPPRGGGIAKGQGSAGGCIDLVTMVRFENLDVVAGRQGARCALHEFQQDIEREAGIGRDQYGRTRRRGIQSLLGVGIEAGGTDEQRDARCGTGIGRRRYGIGA